MRALAAVAVLFLLATARPALADECTVPRMLVALDKSSSMRRELVPGQTLWEAARASIVDIVAAYGDSIDFGLMLFPDASNVCGGAAVRVDTGPGTATAIGTVLANPPPSAGYWTPMAQSLDQAGTYAPLLDGAQGRYVLLITDGWQWCDPYDTGTRFHPVEAVKRLKAKGITTFVVGFGDQVDTLTLNRAAYEAGTSAAGCNPNGNTATAPDKCYFQADSEGDLTDALDAIAFRTTEETCDGVDNDCDGHADNAVAGDPAPMTVACESACGGGVRTCTNGAWSTCSGRAPTPETCNGQDDDCDGFPDNAAAGVESPLTRTCSNACGAGTETCVAGAWSVCSARTPTEETCNGQDDDCDGFPDNAVTGQAGALTRACASACGAGTESCTDGTWAGCTARVPVTETCDDGIDDDCDGQVDEGCECTPGEKTACGSSEGQCAEGIQTCRTDGTWGDCEGGVPPAAEQCDGRDDNCNGVLDDGATCPEDAMCACGTCAGPCVDGACADGARCVGGYCVVDACPEGMWCDGTTCAPGSPPAQPPGPVQVDEGCQCGGSPLSLFALGSLVLAVRRRRGR